MENLTPKETVVELDKYIIGQNEAKRAVAIALRNRWRRLKLDESMREEISPKNIIMIGPTGVGKTEVSRRLAKLTNAPFIKVEASKFTEVGYVGRDVESIIRDLTELSVKMVKDEASHKVIKKAEEMAEERILDALLPGTHEEKSQDGVVAAPVGFGSEVGEAAEVDSSTRQKFRKMFREGTLDDREIELEISEGGGPNIEIFSMAGMEEMDSQLKDMFSNIMPKKSKIKKMTVAQAHKLLIQEESQKLIDMDDVTGNAIKRVQETGIVFIDEIDKIAGRNTSGGGGPDVSREGVQRDLLPIVEGSTIKTKYGMVKTDHILFIASGAFHIAKPSDLIPEFQGRFPIRVELNSLNKEDFVRILTEPANALLKQYTELLKTEGVTLSFSEDGVEELSRVAEEVNDKLENIGARRLHTVLERVLDTISFDAPQHAGQNITIDSAYVQDKLSDILKDEDLSRYIL